MSTTRPVSSEHRKHIPQGVKLHACLLLLGFTDEEITTKGAINWDHHPAIGLRKIDPKTGALIPPVNDPHSIRPLRAAEHDVKTNGTKATTRGSDKFEMAKTDRLEKRRAAAATLLAKPRHEAKPTSRRLQSRNNLRKENRRG